MSWINLENPSKCSNASYDKLNFSTSSRSACRRTWKKLSWKICDFVYSIRFGGRFEFWEMQNRDNRILRLLQVARKLLTIHCRLEWSKPLCLYIIPERHSKQRVLYRRCHLGHWWNILGGEKPNLTECLPWHVYPVHWGAHLTHPQRQSLEMQLSTAGQNNRRRSGWR